MASFSFAQALRQGNDDFDRARQAAKTLPPGSADQAAPPKTLNEALTIVSLREEEKKRREGRRDSKKIKAGPSSPGGAHHQFPGSVPGQERDQSAYWMIMEVRRAWAAARACWGFRRGGPRRLEHRFRDRTQNRSHHRTTFAT